MKTGTLSHKNKKLVSKDKDEWIVVENAHEAIISQERWDEAQCIDLAKNKNRMEPQESLFKSLMKCDDCGSVLASHWSRYIPLKENELVQLKSSVANVDRFIEKVKEISRNSKTDLRNFTLVHR